MERLRKALGNVAETKGVIAILADQPAEQRRTELHPTLPAIITELVTGKKAPDPQSTRVLFRFVAGELRRDPDLPPVLFEALVITPPRHAYEHLHELYVLARDRRAIPLLRGGAAHAMWAEAVIALFADKLLDEVFAALAVAPTRELAVACGYVGGERSRDVLAAGTGDVVHPIGLALLANPEDKAYFAAGGPPNWVIAKRIHAALAAKGPKQRADAIAELARGLDAPETAAPVERLVALTLALGDKRADVVERAAAVLATHANAARAKLRPAIFPAFLERAAQAIANGVTEAARVSLDAVRKRIPDAPLFGAAKPVEAPLARGAAATKQGKEILAAMHDAAFDASNLRDAGIEAEIAIDPDAQDPYSVYADWLQTRRDPRGQWIALHTVKGLAAKAALEAFLREHRESILGPLRPFVVEDGPIELEWFMGFVRRARFAAHATVDVVRALLDATCGAFVQELAFANAGLSADVIALLHAKRPVCLARLAFGARDEVPAELVTALPRLQRSPLARWQAALERLGEQRKSKLDIVTDEFPALVTGLGVTSNLDTILLGLKHELGGGHPIGLAGAMVAVFTPPSLDAFACALVESYRDFDRHAWALPAAGAIGGPRTARALGALFPERSERRRVAVCDQLRAIVSRGGAGGSAAVEELAYAAFAPASYHNLHPLARQALGALFPHGFDAGLAELPAWSDTRAREAQRVWLESMMIEGRTFTRAAFDALATRRRTAVRSLLWCDRKPDGTIALFRVDEHGAPVRRDNTPHTTTGTIGIVHPVELSDAELDGARATFANVEQVILQLERPTFVMSAGEAQAEELDRFVRRRVGFHPLANALRERGWFVAASDVEDDDGDERWRGTNAFGRTFARDATMGIATLNDTRGSVASVHVLHRGARVSFDQVHAVTTSELLWDLEVAHGWQPSVPRPTPTTAPIVERAKTGRAKCVVCSEAIAKDSMRIGIERMVETPTFRGMATVWLHPACRANVPELAGVILEGLD